MKRNYCLSVVLLALFGVSVPYSAVAADNVLSSQSTYNLTINFILVISLLAVSVSLHPWIFPETYNSICLNESPFHSLDISDLHIP